MKNSSFIISFEKRFYCNVGMCKKSYILPADTKTEQSIGKLHSAVYSVQTAVVMCFVINWEESGQVVN